MNKNNCAKLTISFISVITIILDYHSTLALSWDGEYILKDLELNGTDFVEQELPYWNLSSYYSSAHNKYYNCNGTYLLGGYQVLGTGRGQYFERRYTDLPGHNKIEMQITFYPLDSWDGESDDHFDIYFDGNEHYAWKLDLERDYAYDQCGRSGYPDLPPIRATIHIPHSASNLTFRVVSQFDDDTADESLGFRDIVMNFVNVSTQYYSLCGIVNTGVLPNPCISDKYLNSNGSCSIGRYFPLGGETIADNTFCINKGRILSALGCTDMQIKYIKATTQGYEYKLQFTPPSCDWDPTDLQDQLNSNQEAHTALGDYSFAVTRTQPAQFILDLTLSQSVLEDKTINLTFGTLSGQMVVFRKFSPTALALKLKAIAESIQTAITAATGATIVSALVMQTTASVWGFVGFQQFINFLKYINIQYPFQMEMLFVLGGGTKFNGTMPNVFIAVTQSEYNKLILDEDLVDEQAPPRKFADYDETSFYIQNGGSIILMNLVFLVITTLIALLRKIKVVRENTIFGIVDVNLRWNFLLRSFLMTSIPLGVAICLQLRRLIFEGSTYLAISSWLSIASALYFVIISVVMLRILYTRNPEEFLKKECLDVYGTLTKGLNVKNHSSKYYYMLVLLRGVIMSVLIVFAQDIPFLQIVCLFVINVGLFAYIFRNVDFANAKETRKSLITEFLIIIAEVLIALLTAKNKSEQYYDIIAWSIVGIIGLIFINELVFIVLVQIATISSLIQKLKEKRKKKRDTKSTGNKSFVELAVTSSPTEEGPTMIKGRNSISSEQPELFMNDEDQPSPENIARLAAAKNRETHLPADRMHMLPWPPLVRQRQRTSNLLTKPVTPLSGDIPPLFEDPNSIIIEEGGSITAERLSVVISIVDHKIVQGFNSDPYS